MNVYTEDKISTVSFGTKDFYGTQTDYIRLIFIVYSLIMLVIGIGANIFVTYSTFTYRSKRFDRCSFILFRNLSVADGIYATLVILPVLMNNISRSWMFGNVLCKWAAATRLTFLSASTNFLTAISIHRLVQAVNPLRNYIRQTKNNTVISLILWIYSSIASIRLLVCATFQVNYDPTIAYCIFGNYQDSTEHIVYTLSMLAIPFIIVIFSHAILCYISINRLTKSECIRKKSMKAVKLSKKRCKGKGITQTLLTLGSLSALLVVSWFPNVLTHLLGHKDSRWRNFHVAAMYLYFLNTAGNPIIYTLVNREFKNYAKRQIVSVITKETNESSNRNRTYIAKISPLSAGNSSYIRPVKSSIL